MCKKYISDRNFDSNDIISIYSLYRLFYEDRECWSRKLYNSEDLICKFFSKDCDCWLLEIKHNYSIIMNKSCLWNYNYWWVIKEYYSNCDVTIFSNATGAKQFNMTYTLFNHMSNIIKLYKRLPFIYSLRLMSGTAIQIGTSLCTTFTMSEKFYNTRCNRNIYIKKLLYNW